MDALSFSLCPIYSIHFLQIAHSVTRSTWLEMQWGVRPKVFQIPHPGLSQSHEKSTAQASIRSASPTYQVLVHETLLEAIGHMMEVNQRPLLFCRDSHLCPCREITQIHLENSSQGRGVWFNPWIQGSIK